MGSLHIVLPHGCKKGLPTGSEAFLRVRDLGTVRLICITVKRIRSKHFTLHPEMARENVGSGMPCANLVYSFRSNRNRYCIVTLNSQPGVVHTYCYRRAQLLRLGNPEPVNPDSWAQYPAGASTSTRHPRTSVWGESRDVPRYRI